MVEINIGMMLQDKKVGDIINKIISNVDLVTQLSSKEYKTIALCAEYYDIEMNQNSYQVKSFYVLVGFWQFLNLSNYYREYFENPIKAILYKNAFIRLGCHIKNMTLEEFVDSNKEVLENDFLKDYLVRKAS